MAVLHLVVEPTESILANTICKIENKIVSLLIALLINITTKNRI